MAQISTAISTANKTASTTTPQTNSAMDSPNAVPIKDDSLDLERSFEVDLITEVKVRNQVENPYLWKVIVGIFVGSLVTLTMFALQQDGCSEGSMTPCMPQISLKMNRGKSNETQELLSKMQDALKTLSIFAKDFGVGNNNNLVFEDIDQLEHVSTFEEGNKFMFNYYGYCRTGASTKGETKCLNTNGLNIGATMIYDLGNQLAKLSHVSPNELIDAFLMTYGQLVSSLSSVYKKHRANIKGFDDVDVTGLLVTERLQGFYEYSKIMLVLSKMVIVISLIMPIILGNVILLFGVSMPYAAKTIEDIDEHHIQSPKGTGLLWFIQAHLRRVLYLAIGLFVWETLCLLAIMSLDIYVHWRLGNFEQSNGIFNVSYGSGFYLLPIIIALCSGSMFFFILVLKKRWA
ncbi:Meiosis-specific prospore membrane protein [Scheffersomyces spartinae]|uniref:Meiosis-specific prospore membrane protein n=1 Tax=Scheffersomyces spartinae TaxID=45513 RepID=A0A9P8AID3_9ASCO|nr:Meiosis-specific prospore membrane protein [Scheffersomyces spartinae]KAG7193544.1 Meiosis-specific prospore membrane protein [Scheffersomyces spartinae]